MQGLHYVVAIRWQLGSSSRRGSLVDFPSLSSRRAPATQESQPIERPRALRRRRNRPRSRRESHCSTNFQIDTSIVENFQTLPLLVLQVEDAGQNDENPAGSLGGRPVMCISRTPPSPVVDTTKNRLRDGSIAKTCPGPCCKRVGSTSRETLAREGPM